jgi:single-strand DNA-binding protein
MLILTLAGNVGRDAEFKTTQTGQEFCSFSVGVSVGYGENKSTQWVDVTKWGKGAEGLSRILRKGSKVAVSGEMGLRENGGKTYVQCRANEVTIMGTPAGGGGAPEQVRKPAEPNAGQWPDDDEDIPFATNQSVW